MGYDFHITRRNDWSDDDGPAITADEWLRVVEDDPELRLDSTNGPHHALWDGPSNGAEAWLDWSRGNIFAKNPDQPVIQKMVEIAGRLDAKVQGDDGEVYGARYLSGPEHSPVVTSRVWLEFIAGMAMPAVLLLALGTALLALILWLSP